jgi:hypothetical protein
MAGLSFLSLALGQAVPETGFLVNPSNLVLTFFQRFFNILCPLTYYPWWTPRPKASARSTFYFLAAFGGRPANAHVLPGVFISVRKQNTPSPSEKIIFPPPTKANFYSSRPLLGLNFPFLLHVFYNFNINFPLLFSSSLFFRGPHLFIFPLFRSPPPITSAGRYVFSNTHTSLCPAHREIHQVRLLLTAFYLPTTWLYCIPMLRGHCTWLRLLLRLASLLLRVASSPLRLASSLLRATSSLGRSSKSMSLSLST